MHSESRWRSDYIRMFCCPPAPHCLGNPTVKCIGDITLLFSSSDKCKPLQVLNFLLCPNGALYHWNVKFQTFYIQKLLLGNVWSIPTTLQTQQNYEVKNIWGLYKGTQVGLLLLRTKPSYSRDYVCWEGKAKKPQSSKITANTRKCFDIVSMLSVFKFLNDLLKYMYLINSIVILNFRVST